MLFRVCAFTLLMFLCATVAFPANPSDAVQEGTPASGAPVKRPRVLSLSELSAGEMRSMLARLRYRATRKDVSPRRLLLEKYFLLNQLRKLEKKKTADSKTRVLLEFIRWQLHVIDRLLENLGKDEGRLLFARQ